MCALRRHSRDGDGDEGRHRVHVLSLNQFLEEAQHRVAVCGRHQLLQEAATLGVARRHRLLAFDLDAPQRG